MIKVRIKNQSYRPKFDVGDILELVGCKINSRNVCMYVYMKITQTKWDS